MLKIRIFEYNDVWILDTLDKLNWYKSFKNESKSIKLKEFYQNIKIIIN